MGLLRRCASRVLCADGLSALMDTKDLSHELLSTMSPDSAGVQRKDD